MAIINKKLIHFNNIATFNNCLVAANADNTTWLNAGTNAAEAFNASKNQIKYLSIVYIKDAQKVWTHGLIYNSKEYKEATTTEAGLLSADDKYIIDKLVDSSADGISIREGDGDETFPPLYIDIDGYKELFVYDGQREPSSTATNFVIEKGLYNYLIGNANYPFTTAVYKTFQTYLNNGNYPYNVYANANTSILIPPLTYNIENYGEEGIEFTLDYNVYEGNRELNAEANNFVTEKGLNYYLNSSLALATTEKQGLITPQEKATLNSLSTTYAQLDGSGKVLSSQLPSYVDDVLEFTSKSNFPTTGESGKIYVDTNTNLTYRWSGTQYVEISKSLALGYVAGTALPGSYGVETRNQLTTAINDLPNKINKAIDTNEGNKKLIITIPESWFSSPTSGILNITSFKAPSQTYITNNNYDLYIKRSGGAILKANAIYREGDIMDGNPKYSIFDCVFVENSVQHSMIVEVEYTDKFTIKAEMEGKTILDRLNALDGGTVLYPATNSLKSQVDTLYSEISNTNNQLNIVKADAPLPLKLYLNLSSTTVTTKESPDADHIKNGNFDVYVAFTNTTNPSYEKAIINREMALNYALFYRRYRISYNNKIYEIKIVINGTSIILATVTPVGVCSSPDPKYPLDSAVVNLPALANWPSGITDDASITTLSYGEVKNLLNSFLITINGGAPFKPLLTKPEYVSTGSVYTYKFVSNATTYYIKIDLDNSMNSFYLRYYK